MNLAVAIVLGAALIAGAILNAHRYEIRAHRVACSDEHGTCSALWRVDQWTGEMWFCEHANVTQCVTVKHENRKPNP